MDLRKSEALCQKAVNVMELVKPIDTRDYGQVTEDIDGFAVVFNTNALKGGLFQSRLSVAGDHVQSKSGLKSIAGISFTGTKNEVLEWVKYTLPTLVDSLKSMAST